ncbi:MAG: CDP-diacylglycerol--glycerol-3-phosphate 3-phosphatidyltransferase [Candidatus Margulisiibacteriota bacterium]|nr:MAG: CDP-diacylglycerol--glycerol-3-phosphate 3-phosphatidyltransferase [Candidatus Margulisbacteria bacterium GWD2_39_127]OGI02111.1 MAG: CDP-diacylglycerol--glycerol-3-phosphate 3-phosphatidyltransferase [Candidatus Margulisbacteria bacterium GWF2_38_17]OGI10488.1 MAG: CDP-diacylglycerol--glycerol-3-phosphate 3-phosphatidyltransferase [Candidatus Margulisbacteria bacterium GWE2_39_32]PZM79966.1 MAG: CDP-diacylglycerol--glycerol-3-phosphate 3-phosphatidyltransferase [Candidatus Margulisiibac
MTLASKITLARIFATPVIVYLLLTTNTTYSRLFVILLFVITSLTDVIDGYLARRLKQITTLGKFLDPLADKLLITSVLICMVEMRLVESIPVIIIIAREFAVTGLRLIAAGEGVVIDASRWGKYKTIAQVVTVIILLLRLDFAVIFLWLTVLITVLSGFDYFKKNIRIFAYEG